MTQKTKEIYLIIGALLLVSLLGVMLVFNYRNRLKAEAHLGEQREEVNRRRIMEMLRQQEASSVNAMLEGREKERKRVAADLHDSLGGLLATAKLHLGTMQRKLAKLLPEEKEKYKAANNLLDEAVAEVRRISHAMNKGIVTEFGLSRALEEMVSVISQAGKIKAKFEAGPALPEMDSEKQIGLYRIAQELVNNSLKHANANQIKIKPQSEKDAIILEVKDDGVGFEMSHELLSQSEGMGLGSVKRRAEGMGGKLTINTQKGQGSQFLIRI